MALAVLGKGPEMATAVYLEAFYQAARAKGWSADDRVTWFKMMHRPMGYPTPVWP